MNFFIAIVVIGKSVLCGLQVLCRARDVQLGYLWL